LLAEDSLIVLCLRHVDWWILIDVSKDLSSAKEPRRVLWTAWSWSWKDYDFSKRR